MSDEQRAETRGGRSDVTQIRSRTLAQAAQDAGFKDTHLADTRPETWASILADVPLFSDLGHRDHVRIATAAKIAHVSAGQYICRAGFSAEAFYVLLTGRAVVERADGGRLTLTRGNFFGELGLIDGAPRTANVVAETELWTARLPKDTFAELVDREPTIARGIMEALVARIRRLEAEAAACAAGTD
jgi:CRP/FNR family cyclic AMP-dependent transcriptional regulator